MWSLADKHIQDDAVPWQFSYLLKKANKNVIWEVPELEGYPNKALSALFRFQGIDIPWIPEERKKLKDRIRKHLMSFGGSGAQKKYTDISHEIDMVCERAKPLLAAYTNKKRPSQAELDSSSPLYKLAFEERWLTNVSRLLPDCPEVLAVLPYLLTCYTIDIRRNQVDPFDEDASQYANNRAWVDIFYDQASPFVKDQRKTFGGIRRTESIDRICSYFVLPTNYRCNAFLGYLQVYDYTHSAKGRLLKPKEVATYSLACWEAYRRFACFCVACKGIVEADLVRSLILFSSIWDYRSLCRPICNNPICEERIGRCCYDSPNSIMWSDEYLSVLELERVPGSSEPTIQEFVFDMWDEYRYNNQPKAKLE